MPWPSKNRLRMHMHTRAIAGASYSGAADRKHELSKRDSKRERFEQFWNNLFGLDD
jgi:hypothetical protein